MEKCLLEENDWFGEGLRKRARQREHGQPNLEAGGYSVPRRQGDGGTQKVKQKGVTGPGASL